MSNSTNPPKIPTNTNENKPLNPNKFKLALLPTKDALPYEREQAKERRDEIIYALVLDYINEHPSIFEYSSLWKAFKNKQTVRLKSTNEEVYIHSIQSNIEWETCKVQTRFTISRKNKDEFKEEYENGLTVCQPEELEVI